MTPPHAKIDDLLAYIEQIERLNHKPPYVIDAASVLGHQVDLAGLPGVELGKPGSSRWMRLSRLSKTSPPKLPEVLMGWVELCDDPASPPALRSSVDQDRQGALKTSQDKTGAPGTKAAFDDYVAREWKPWANLEAPRRASVRLYQKLFTLHQSIAMDASDAPVELLWGMGMSSWHRVSDRARVHHPMITQACEVSLDPISFALSVSPLSVNPTLEIECYADMGLSGVKKLEEEWVLWLAAQNDDVNPAPEICPFDESSFRSVLKSAAADLCAAGSYEPNLQSAPNPAGSNLVVTASWTLYARKRSNHVLLRDLERLRVANAKMREEGVALPGFAEAFVSEGSKVASHRPRINFRGRSGGSGESGARELYFPLPYNGEQERIVEELQTQAGVVVQGPPGTGKTHTIANVVSHFLAQGKRVLVTSKGETALSVLKEKLPPEIGKLAVALLTDESDGLRQFEQSITAISDDVARIDARQTQKEIDALHARIDRSHAQIAAIDRELSELAAEHLGEREYGGSALSLMDIAKKLEEGRAALSWIEHSKMPDEESGIDGGVLDKARAARLRMGSGLAQELGGLGDVEALPSPGALRLVHEATLLCAGFSEMERSGKIQAAEGAGMNASVKSADFVAKLTQSCEAREALAQDGSIPAWLGLIEQGRPRGESDPAAVITALSVRLIELEACRREGVSDAVELPQGAQNNDALVAELERKAQGGSDGLMGMLCGREVKRLRSEVRVAKSEPKDAKDWGKALKRAMLARDSCEALARWDALASEFGMEKLPDGDVFVRLRAVQAQARAVELSNAAALAFKEAQRLGAEIFPGVKVAQGRDFLGTISAQIEHFAQWRCALGVSARGQELARQLASWHGRLSHELRDFVVSRVGSAHVSGVEIESGWADLLARAQAARALRPELALIDAAATMVEAAGSPQWAQRLRSEPVEGDGTLSLDRVAASNWRDAWAWRAWSNEVGQYDRHGELAGLCARRLEEEECLASLYEQVVVKMAWLGVKNQCSPEVSQKLRQYLNAVRSVGKGSGVRAERHRKSAREAMVEAYKAIPCWIMPHWRVSETMLAEIGLFDLVVVDEASQSDIWALPALLRGKQILVVGDHKQVSPSAVGVAEDSIRELQARFLRGQPHGSEMTPDKSIYDLASVVFADSAVMLKEHFRSVPAIIEFSNRAFYGGKVRPLRTPGAVGPVDPPLIDVLVRDGSRQGDKNPAEAEAIVNEIEKMMGDGAYEGQSIGVVTLLGSEQAVLISKLIQERIDPAQIVARGIVAGSPATFQGRERDIMFISMVLAPGNRAFVDKLDVEQRLNVAMSRARDRVYLYRSVEVSDLNPESLTVKLIEHFAAPFQLDPSDSARSRGLCESSFERDMFDKLTERGYRILPQFPCGGLRIDLVAEGPSGARLAIECDGDRFHGPSQWPDDMARQRVLERAGWTFWRCFGSTFLRRREEVMEDLIEALVRLGVEPWVEEPGAIKKSRWAEHREVLGFPAATGNDANR